MLALLYVLARWVAPSAPATTTTRRNPVMRETVVQSATVAAPRPRDVEDLGSADGVSIATPPE